MSELVLHPTELRLTSGQRQETYTCNDKYISAVMQRISVSQAISSCRFFMRVNYVFSRSFFEFLFLGSIVGSYLKRKSL